MPIDHRVKAQECLSSIAEEYGFFPGTIWDDPRNADLRRERVDGNVLREGDVVVVPDLRQRGEKIATAKRHRFRRKGVPEILRLRLCDPRGRPRAGLSYVLVIDGVPKDGTTDSDGRIKVWIPTGAKRGELRVSEKGRVEIHPLTFSALVPLDGEDGVRQRLLNLGYLAEADADDAEVERGLRRFQEDHKVPVTGLCDDATKRAIEALYRSR
jgi:N-acetylmuramoyl-L-alanine amidase